MARRCVLCGVKKGKILSKFPKHGAKRTLWLAAVELGEENISAAFALCEVKKVLK